MAIILELEYILIGIFTLFGVVSASFLGGKIALKYLKVKKRDFLLLGFTVILICEPWWPATIGFLWIMITGQNLPLEVYLVLGIVLLPLLALIWLTAFTDLIFKEYQKKILNIFAIYGIAFELALFSLLYVNTSLIGDLSGYYDPNYGPFVRIYQYSLMGFLGITFILFARECRRSENPDTKLKGSFIFAAITTFVLGSTLDIIAQALYPNPNFVVLVLIARSIMILTALEFYGAMILPKWIKKLISKSK